MTLRLVLIFLLAMCGSVQAEPIRVTGGAHDGFTRLVLSGVAPGDWRLGRTADGYALWLSAAAPVFDLSEVFARIGRNRLAAIWANPEDATLRLGVACACHAIPFEFRPGIIVIDLRDGPPPDGSSFEQALDGNLLPALATTAPPRPRARPAPPPQMFDWTDLALGRRWSAPDAPPAPAPPDPTFRLPETTPPPIKDALLRELSRAVGQGLVDPARQLPPPGGSGDAAASLSNLQIGESILASTQFGTGQPLAADGATCPSDAALAVAAWGNGDLAQVQLSDATAGLVGEFDQPQPDALRRAIQTRLHLGFGAEAAALIAAFPPDHPDRPLWQSMARLVDGFTDPDGAFAGLAACDTAAALWSTLADPGLSRADVNRPALLRAFSALPPHLRRHLGPALAESFLATDDIATAQALADAILRAPGPPDPRLALMQARFAAARGETDLAASNVATVLNDPGAQSAAALVALVDLHLADAAPFDPAKIIALQSHLTEAEGTAEAPALARALVLAHALAGDFDAAFAALPDAPDAGTDLWRLLAKGPDSAVLLYGLGAAPANLPAETRDAMVERLVALGFPVEAQRWSGSSTPVVMPAPDQDRQDAVITARDWASIAADGPPDWQAAAQSLSSAPPDGGPLTRGRATAEASAETRAALDALLSAVPKPVTLNSDLPNPPAP